MPAITVAEFNAIITEELTWAADIGMHARAIDDGTATLVLPFDGNMVRPGGTVS
ncbi:MAG: PaaI family thioesterase, partial [Rhodospirillaceae bacterium]|nr:PaaI family thioesterase [Rhodospirillaceae bacterium]